MAQPDLESRFTYHPPGTDQVLAHERIRRAGLMFARFLKANCPESWEQRVAIDQVDMAVMWANAAVARRS